MADPSLAADQSGLSDLSVAFIGPHLDQATPTLDDQAEIHTSTTSLAPTSLTPNTVRIDSETALRSASRTVRPTNLDATPGPSRIRTLAADGTGPAWTPSPEASNSRSRSRSRSLRRSTSPRSVKDANESVGSSLGTFDYSNASFSESFLRQAGANMLAGLAEAEHPTQSSSSSPRYRTSSSPTVTARPLKQQADPRTPFTGKSLRTRMAEAGMLDSPASSDGSSPARSPTARTAGESPIGSWSGSGSLEAQHGQQELSHSYSPHAQQYDRGINSLAACAGSPYQHGKSWSVEMVHKDPSRLEAEQDDWQEGLSTVPEESYIEELSQLPVLPTNQAVDSPKSVEVLASPTRTLPRIGGEDALRQSPTNTWPAATASRRLSTAPSTPADSRIHHSAISNTPGDAVPSPYNASFATPASRQLSVAPSTPAISRLKHDALSATPGDAPSSPFDASFATPASHKQVSAPSSPAASKPTVKDLSATPGGDADCPKDFFRTPQWSPSPAAKGTTVHETKQSAQESAETESSPRSFSSCSSSSEKKQLGEMSTSSRVSESGDHHEDEKNEPSFDSPSAARFSRLQVSRISSSTSEFAAPSLPALASVSNAIKSLTELSDSRVARLLAQLSASTGCIEELEAALEAKEQREAILSGELEDVRYELRQLNGQYEEFVKEAEEREAETRRLMESLKERIGEGMAKGRTEEVVELRRGLQEERRLREMERKDYEVRLQGLLMNSASSASSEASAHEPGSVTTPEIEAAKEHMRMTMEKDFAIRQSIENRGLNARIAELESKLASTTEATERSQEDQEKSELRKKLEQMESKLDRRFEELCDVREDLETMAKEKEVAEDRVAGLENELNGVQEKYQGRSDSAKEEELVEELRMLRENLIEKEGQVGRLEETLSLTQSRLEGILAERDMLANQLSLAEREDSAQALASEQEVLALRERISSLESHILTLEDRLRSHHSPASTPSKVGPAPLPALSTEHIERQSKLEKELANANLELVKLTKANEALQEDNVNFSIALGAKQLELGMVKRNARFALKNAHAQAKADASHHIGLPLSKTVSTSAEPVEELAKAEKAENRVWPSVPKGNLGAEDKENQPLPEKGVNSARANARALLAQRRALGRTTSHGVGQQERRQRLAVLA